MWHAERRDQELVDRINGFQELRRSYLYNICCQQALLHNKINALGLPVQEGILEQTVLVPHQYSLFPRAVFLEDGEHQFGLSDVCHMQLPAVVAQSNMMI
jgi:hypothetical protein